MLWVLLVAASLTGIALYMQWYDLPKFQDVTIELGQEMPPLSAFFTEHTVENQAVMVSDPVDVSQAGTYELTFRHSAKEETVYLVVQDTTAPTATFQDVTAEISAVITPESFVTEANDLSPITVSFVKPLSTPESYGDFTVEVQVADAYGNAIIGTCKIYYVWMLPAYTLELGDTLDHSDLLLDPEKDADLLNQAQIDAINAGGVGTYILDSSDGSLSCQCTVTVVDTTAPTLKLKEVAIYKGKTAKLEDFIESVYDLSGDVKTKLLTKLDFSKMGEQTVIIEATDIYGNVTTAETILRIAADTTPPSFSGVSDMTVNKHSSPDYEQGVSAYDSKDGKVPFTVDSSRVNTAKAGTYYVIYTAKDNSGNKATYRRKVVVLHDAEDTDELVKTIAATLPNDPEAVRDYVRNSISYSANWGGSDPVWYGFKNKSGNCYVHALCLQRLLTEKGYTTQLIWVNHIRDGRPSHYWLIINLNGVWRHIDATPSRMHGRYSLMTDAQRYETLVSGNIQRDWDRDKWPACI